MKKKESRGLLGSLLLIALFLLPFGSVKANKNTASAVKFYISEKGKDNAQGTQQKPLKTIQAAQLKAQSYFGNSEVHFIFMDGTHYLSSPISILPTNSGTQEFPVIYTAQHEGKATISGCTPLDVKWKSSTEKIYQATLKTKVISEELYVNGERKNSIDELNTPNTWFYNEGTQMLYCYPAEGADVKNTEVGVLNLKHLVEFKGDANNKVQHVTLTGLSFKHTAVSTSTDSRESLLRSDWTVYRGGAILLEGTVACTITNSDFDQIAGNAIFVSNFNRDLSISNCHIQRCGANGIAFVGDTKAVKNAMHGNGAQNYAQLDRTEGPNNENYPSNCKIHNCIIASTGITESKSAAVLITMSHKITVENSSIYDTPAMGINIHEGAFGGHVIAHCDIFNTGLKVANCGSINASGRDRFWTEATSEVVAQVAADENLPFLDILSENVICDNRLRSENSWDINLGEGASNYIVYNNLLLNGGLRLGQGYGREVYNNIIINNTLHMDSWYANSGDIFRNNLVFGEYTAANMENATGKDGKWGKEIDFNIFVFNKNGESKFAANGCDVNSVNCDPQFLKPESGNFLLRGDSPALRLGFKLFPQNKFGVSSASLKEVVKTPEIPSVNVMVKTVGAITTRAWQDLMVRDIETLAELSGLGLKEACGVLVIAIHDDSILKEKGIKLHDVILRVDGESVCSSQELRKFRDINANTEISVWRNETRVELK